MKCLIPARDRRNGLRENDDRSTEREDGRRVGLTSSAGPSSTQGSSGSKGLLRPQPPRIAHTPGPRWASGRRPVAFMAGRRLLVDGLVMESEGGGRLA